MDREGVTPNVVTYTALIKGYLPPAAINPSALGDILDILDEVNAKTLVMIYIEVSSETLHSIVQ